MITNLLFAFASGYLPQAVLMMDAAERLAEIREGTFVVRLDQEQGGTESAVEYLISLDRERPIISVLARNEDGEFLSQWEVDGQSGWVADYRLHQVGQNTVELNGWQIEATAPTPGSDYVMRLLRPNEFFTENAVILSPEWSAQVADGRLTPISLSRGEEWQMTFERSTDDRSQQVKTVLGEDPWRFELEVQDSIGLQTSVSIVQVSDEFRQPAEVPDHFYSVEQLDPSILPPSLDQEADAFRNAMTYFDNPNSLHYEVTKGDEVKRVAVLGRSIRHTGERFDWLLHEGELTLVDLQQRRAWTGDATFSQTLNLLRELEVDLEPMMLRMVQGENPMRLWLRSGPQVQFLGSATRDGQESKLYLAETDAGTISFAISADEKRLLSYTFRSEFAGLEPSPVVAIRYLEPPENEKDGVFKIRIPSGFEVSELAF
ncbi:MAG: hypothetical protein ACOCX1_02135 [Fimbriimonadaceae bacterium]